MELINLKLVVNGKSVGPMKIPAQMPVIDFLHEELALTGTKFGCGIAACRACTILVRDDKTSAPEPMVTCIMPVESINNKHITTVEGLAQKGDLSLLQEKFLEHFAFQCGYCAPGFLMSATAMLENQSNPIPAGDVDAVIAEAIGDNLCRCTGYVKYVEALRAALNKAGLISKT